MEVQDSNGEGNLWQIVTLRLSIQNLMRHLKIVKTFAFRQAPLPTIITLNVQPEHITGINLFYLPRRFRKYVIKFYKIRMTNEPEFPRSLMYYDMVKKLRIPRSVLKPAIKKYRFDRAGAVAIEYDSSLWEEIYYGDTADFLERQWRKSSRNTIYRNAIIEIISSFIAIKT